MSQKLHGVLASLFVLLMGCLCGNTAAATVAVDEQVLAVPLKVTNGALNFPSNVSIAIHPITGRPHVVFASPSGAIYHGERGAQGWAVERLDSLGRSLVYPEMPQILFDATGVGHVVYINTGYLPPLAFARGPQILYRRLENGLWSPPEPTTPSGIIFSNNVRDLDMRVSSDGSVVAIVASRGNAPAVAQVRTPSGWGPRVTLYTAGQVSTAVTSAGAVILGMATQSDSGLVMNQSLAGDVTVEATLPGSIDLLRILAEESEAGDRHAAWIDLATHRLNYWLHNPVFGWHVVPLPDAVSAAALGGSAGNDLKFAVTPGSGLPWFLTSRGSGGKIDGALLALSYASRGQWFTEPLNQARGIDWRNTTLTLGSMLMASLAIDASNSCHVAWQQLDTTSVGLEIRHVAIAPVDPPALGVGGGPGTRGPRLAVPSVVRGGSMRVQIQTAAGLPSAPARLEILDVAGRSVWNERIFLEGSTSVVADLGSIRPGLYFVRLVSGSDPVFARFSLLN